MELAIRLSTEAMAGAYRYALAARQNQGFTG
jgi:hypothetical protein